MTIEYLLQKQAELDDFIVKSKNITISPSHRLTNTVLAMMVEAGEMANEIRCFKHWSGKPQSDDEIIIGEYVDILHFMLSIANQLGFTEEDIEKAYNKKNQINFDRQKQGY